MIILNLTKKKDETMKLKDLKGEYECEALFKTDHNFEGIPFIYENSEAIAEKVIAQLKEQGCEDIKIEGNKIYFGNQFFNLPNLPSNRKGTITFRSKDYIFSCPEWKEGRGSYGNKPKSGDMTDKGFIIESRLGHIEYKIGAKIK